MPRSPTPIPVLSQKTCQVTDAIGQAYRGAGALATGQSELCSGLHNAAARGSDLDRGSRALVGRITGAQDELPTYSSTERQNLASVISEPVTTGSLGGPADSALGWSTVLLVLALWLGTLVIGAGLPPRAAEPRDPTAPVAALLWRALRPELTLGAAQARSRRQLRALGCAIRRRRGSRHNASPTAALPHRPGEGSPVRTGEPSPAAGTAFPGPWPG